MSFLRDHAQLNQVLIKDLLLFRKDRLVEQLFLVAFEEVSDLRVLV